MRYHLQSKLGQKTGDKTAHYNFHLKAKVIETSVAGGSRLSRVGKNEEILVEYKLSVVRGLSSGETVTVTK